MDGKVRTPGRAYWLCQAAGWGLYTLYVLAWAVEYEHGWHLKTFISVIGFLMIGAPVATHALRAWIIRHRWLDMPIARMLPRGAVAVVLMAFTLGFATTVVNVFVLHNGEWHQWFPRAIFGISSGYATAFSIWLWIYFSVQDRRRRRELELKTLKLEVVARDAHLRTLESQLNPHFLFNALNSVRALVVEDPPRAQTMITRLAELLRYTLRTASPTGRDIVALDDEIRAVEGYLAIERVRFEERLTVTIDIDPEARRHLVPRMLVLTLVENAVKHGISRLIQGGAVSIKATVAGDRLQIRVVNTGSLPSHASTTGVGLSNARERLQLMYGGTASLTLEADGTSVVATASMPLQALAAEAVS